MSGTYTIGKRVRFDAARTVAGVDSSDSLTAEIVLTARELTETGFVCDFGELAGLQEHIDAVLDHRDLDTVLPDASDDAIADYLHHWASGNLPSSARARLSGVRILTGRCATPLAPRAVGFRARHWLRGLPAGHKCARQHGHAYLVTVPDRSGTLLPVPGDLRAYVMSAFHQKALNDVVGVNPTSELLAAHLTGWLAEHGVRDLSGRPLAIRVSETESTWAEFEPGAPV
ncbi:6-carboxytetrahydropterin synthase [Streptomyces sp. NPDC037389]|uniref:6-carboxytetrahydropterin synthase n=1 Tax=Streptomyces sp. NPDC037389 TaxID=3155369 RepID=UPI0033C59F0A